jgi:hypothetical protein
MSYVALKPIKVQKLGTDGKPVRNAQGRPILELRQPGDAVPEAATWPDAGLWEKRGYIERNEGVKPAKYRAIKPEFVAVPKKGAAVEEPTSKGEAAPSSDLAELLELSKKDLSSLADELGVELPAKATKDEIAAAILAKRGASA